MTAPHIVIIGGGLAGAKAALAARAHGFDGHLTLIGDELEVPYERPPLSKNVLRGEADPATTHVADEDTYTKNDIQLLTGTRVTALERRTRQVHLADGTSLEYTTAVLATGAEPNRLGIAGAGLRGVHQLRTISDAVTLRDAIAEANHVAVIGAGWIGSEVAASARQVGADVTLIDPSPTPLHRLMGPEIGGMFRQLHAAHGVHLRLGAGVDEIVGRDAVEALVLRDHTRVDADVVIVGIGVTPRTGLAADAGLELDDGVVVDEELRTSDPNIFAAGDIANAWHPHYRRHLRIEHWANALNQGDTAGQNAAGASITYDRLPYFYSDQYDLGLEYVGHHEAGDRVTIRGDLEQRQFIAYWQRSDDTVTAAMAVNTWDVIDELRATVISGRLP